MLVSFQIKKMKKICIIGGGPSGVSLGKEFSETNIKYDLYESESDFGGVWNGKENCGRVYESAHLISSKGITQLMDFPMPEEYPHYPSHHLILKYWRSVAKEFGVYENTRFNSKVVSLKKEGDGWRLKTENGYSEYYNIVFVCNGLQRKASYPKQLDLNNFTGEIIHSLDYKGAKQIEGKSVLVVGGGNSGCDIAVDCVHYSKAVYHSTRRGYYYQPKFINGMPTSDWMLSLGNKFQSKEESIAYIEQVFKLAGYDGTDYGLQKPDYPIDQAHPILNSQILYHTGHGSIIPKNDVVELIGNTAVFENGSSEKIDLIIFATGYDRDFAFLEDDVIDFKKGVPDLFLHAVPKKVDNLLFIGFINSATGFGSFIKSSAVFSKEYVLAYFENKDGLNEFNKAKLDVVPDLGQKKFLDSHRHLWEVDLWKYLKELNYYTDMLTKA